MLPFGFVLFFFSSVVVEPMSESLQQQQKIEKRPTLKTSFLLNIVEKKYVAMGWWW